MSQVKGKFIDKSELIEDQITNGTTGKAPSSNAVYDALALKISTDQKGAASGVCPLNASTKIDATYLPSYVDDVEEYANLAAFPETGESGKIYLALDTLKIYRWSGSAYSEIPTGSGVLTSSITDGDTTHAPDGNSVYDALAGKASTSHNHDSAYLGISAKAADSDKLNGESASYYATASSVSGKQAAIEFVKEHLTLSSGDITNQYKDLAGVALASSIQLVIDGTVQSEGASYDYTVNLTGGSGGVTRISFVNGLATAGASALVEGDILHLQYMKLSA